MYRVLAIIAALIIGFNLPAEVFAKKGGGDDTAGHGGPKGHDYQLNLIGVPKGKSADMDGNNGRRIFINLFGKSKIILEEGDFKVLDANGTDGSAKFRLPNPDPDGDGVTAYSIWARALGKPGGALKIMTCAVDSDGAEVCDLGGALEMKRSKGRSSFGDVTKKLTSMDVDYDGDGIADDTINLFDDEFEEYFWDLDNNGLKLMQLRFKLEH
jgi:hypothetical protein